MRHCHPPPKRRAKGTESNPVNCEHRRLQSAHTHYRKLPILPDADLTLDEASVYLGHQALEHAPKALI